MTKELERSNIDFMKTSSYDIVVIGAGPSGLSLACALGDTGLRVCLVERQKEATLRDPPLDGRDIALTHDSIALMKELGMFAALDKDEISPIREARVLSGASSYFLGFDTGSSGKTALGHLVPNNQIRRVSYKAAVKHRNITLRCEVEMKRVSTNAKEGTVELTTGEKLRAPLIVAADSRFSAARQQMGISTSITDFGRHAIVCRMTHEKPHQAIAHECFFDDWTLAILPLQGNKSSIVLTLPSAEAEEVMALTPAAFAARIAESLGDRLGAVKLIGMRHTYPLVAVYAGDFTAQRFVLLGDAAVGMHPVTAHGYNLGLGGAALLAAELRKAQSLGIDLGDETVLKAYARGQKRASAFLYYGTNALVGLYTDNRPGAMALRALGLRVANHLPVFKKYVRRQLTGKAA